MKGKHICRNVVSFFILIFFIIVVCILNTIEINAVTIEEVSASDYGANGDDRIDDTEAFNRALSDRKDSNSKLIVKVTKGTYYISDSLLMFSNTELILEDGTRIIATRSDGVLDAPMVLGMHYNDDGTICKPNNSKCRHGGYSQIKNVVINGGIWERGSNFTDAMNSIFDFRHGENITICNAQVYHCTSHMINVSATRNVSIKNVFFYDTIRYTGEDLEFWGKHKVGDEKRYYSLEVIHTDFTNTEGEPYGYPLDNTACEDITVDGCTFNNVHSGIGTHHLNATARMKRIIVKNCNFNNVFGSCINFYSATDCIVENCLANNVSTFVNLVDGNASVRDSDIDGTKENAIFIDNSANATIDNSNIKNSSQAGIRVINDSTASIKETGIANSKLNGISANANSTITIENSNIDNPEKIGLLCEGGANIQVKGGRIDGGINSICVTGAESMISAEGCECDNAKENSIYIGQNATGIIENVSISNAGFSGVRVVGDSSATIKKTQILSPKGNGISVSGSSIVDAHKNDIINPQTTGIYIYDGAKGNINENTILGGLNSLVVSGSNSYVDFTSNNCTDSKENGLYFSDKSTAKVENNRIENSGASGIRITGESDVSIDSNEIIESKTHGVSLSNSAKTEMSNNKIINSGNVGLYVNTGASAEAWNNTITGGNNSLVVSDENSSVVFKSNECSDSRNNSIYIYNEAKGNIEANKIINAGAAAVRAVGRSNVIVKQNEINNPKSHGVSCADEVVAYIDKNKIDNTGRIGVYFVGTLNSKVLGNEITGAKEQGVLLESTKECDVKNNIITESGNHGLQVIGKTQDEIATVTISDNTIKQSGAGFKDIRISDYVSSGTIEGNTICTGGISISSKSSGIIGKNKHCIMNAVISPIDPVVYTGKAITPKVVVRNNSIALLEGRDYTVLFENNTKVGTAIVIINGKGDFEGSISTSFSIIAANISGATVSGLIDKEYTGENITQSIEVKLNGMLLKEGIDYSVAYKNNINVGTATLTITGMDNCIGSKNLSFAIIHTHKYGEWSLLDENQHQRVCSDDSNHVEKENHNWDVGIVTKKATEQSTGVKTFTCIICNGTKSETIPVLNPDYNTVWARKYGFNAYDTMEAIINEGIKDGKFKTGGTVIIATAGGFHDALAAAGLAGRNNAAVVLTKKTELKNQTIRVLKALNPSKVYIAGGEAAVTEAVENAINRTTGRKAERLAGNDAAATSAIMALAANNWSTDRTAIIATNGGFHDALAAAPVAYAKGYPILLASKKGTTLKDPVKNAIKTMGIKKIIIVGGEGAVSEDVEKELIALGINKNNITRLKGDTAIETSAKIAEWGLTHGMTPNYMGVATSADYYDALSGAALCGANNSVLVLEKYSPNAIPKRTNTNFATRYKSYITKAYVFGGPAAISDYTFNALERMVS